MDIEKIIEYPVKKDGSLVSRGKGVPQLPAKAPAATQPGSLHWMAGLMCGSAEKFVQIVESVVVGQGQLAEVEWQRFVVLYREWQRRRYEGKLKRDPNLNDVAYVLNLNVEEFFGKFSTAIQGLFSKVAYVKLLQAAPEAADITIAAMRDHEKGFADRQTVLKTAGVVVDKPGLAVNVNNTNNIGIKVDARNQLIGPLAQFQGTLESVDEAVRDEATMRALGPAQMEDIADGVSTGAQTGEEAQEAAAQTQDRSDVRALHDSSESA